MSNHCDNCPLRLFGKRYNFDGIHNPYSKKVIIIPNIDYAAYKHKDLSFSEQVNIIDETLSSFSTGELPYIVPLIRCLENDQCPTNNEIIRNCLNHLKDDFIKYDFQDILLCGEAAKIFLNLSDIKTYTDNLFVSVNKRRFVVTYNPLVKYTNDDLFNKFKKDLIRWYTSVNARSFINYRIYDNK